MYALFWRLILVKNGNYRNETVFLHIDVYIRQHDLFNYVFWRQVGGVMVTLIELALIHMQPQVIFYATNLTKKIIA